MIQLAAYDDAPTSCWSPAPCRSSIRVGGRSATCRPSLRGHPDPQRCDGTGGHSADGAAHRRVVGARGGNGSTRLPCTGTRRLGDDADLVRTNPTGLPFFAATQTGGRRPTTMQCRSVAASPPSAPTRRQQRSGAIGPDRLHRFGRVAGGGAGGPARVERPTGGQVLAGGELLGSDSGGPVRPAGPPGAAFLSYGFVGPARGSPGP